MATTNTPLATIETLEAWIDYRKQDFNFDNRGSYMLDGKIMNWLIIDAKHVNHLNTRAMEMGYEDAEAALKALAEHEGK